MVYKVPKYCAPIQMVLKTLSMVSETLGHHRLLSVWRPNASDTHKTILSGVRIIRTPISYFKWCPNHSDTIHYFINGVRIIRTPHIIYQWCSNLSDATHYLSVVSERFGHHTLSVNGVRIFRTLYIRVIQRPSSTSSMPTQHPPSAHPAPI